MSTSQQKTPTPNPINGTQATNERTAAQTLAQLIENIQSGNLTGSRTGLVLLIQQSGYNQTTDNGSPLGQLVSTLVGSLGAGNLLAARTDVQNFLTALQSNNAAVYTGNHRNPTTGGGISVDNATGQYSDPVSQAVQEESTALAGATSGAAATTSRR